MLSKHRFIRIHLLVVGLMCFGSSQLAVADCGCNSYHPVVTSGCGCNPCCCGPGPFVRAFHALENGVDRLLSIGKCGRCCDGCDTAPVGCGFESAGCGCEVACGCEPVCGCDGTMSGGWIESESVHPHHVPLHGHGHQTAPAPLPVPDDQVRYDSARRGTLHQTAARPQLLPRVQPQFNRQPVPPPVRFRTPVRHTPVSSGTNNTRLLESGSRPVADEATVTLKPFVQQTGYYAPAARSELVEQPVVGDLRSANRR